MADDPQHVEQDEIEQLLAQMQASKGTAPSPTPETAEPQSSNVSQAEIEALLKQPAAAGAGAPGVPSGGTGTASTSQGPSAQASGSSRTLVQTEVDALLSQSRAAGPGQASGGSAATSTLGTAPQAGPMGALGQHAPAVGGQDEPAPAGATIAESDLERLLAHAQQALASLDQPASAPPGLAPFTLKDFSSSPPAADAATLDLLQDVELDLRIEFGRTQLALEDVLRLRKGSVVALDKLAGDPVDIFVNDRLIARGEVLVLNDNFCIRVAELVAGMPTG